MKSLTCILTGLILGHSIGAFAQYVSVTLRCDTNRVTVGASTALHVFAQIVPDQRANTDRIFSWYVDLLNANGSLAQPDASQLQKPASDNDPRTSSAGFSDGPNRRGIYDTFINRPNAGRDTPVELFSLPIKAVAPGRATFRVEPGSGVSGLDADFIVAPTGGGEPLIGGIYSGASVDLEVVAQTNLSPRLAISHLPLAGGTNRVTLTFTPSAGLNHFVEYRDLLGSGAWTNLPGSPHNAGAATDTNRVAQRFYRLRLNP